MSSVAKKIEPGQFDQFRVVDLVEYLPGKYLYVHLSEEFEEMKDAESSLAFLREKYPGSRIRAEKLLV